MTIFNDIALTLREGRKEKAWNQSELATYANLNRSTISALESGNYGDVGIRKIERVLGLFGKKLTVGNQGMPTLDDLKQMEW